VIYIQITHRAHHTSFGFLPYEIELFIFRKQSKHLCIQVNASHSREFQN
jgi:hypothetical protein